MGITCLFFRRRNRYKTQKNIKINSHLYGQKKNSSNLKYCRYFESIFRKFYLRNELRLLAGLYQIVLYPQSTINLFRRVFEVSLKYLKNIVMLRKICKIISPTVQIVHSYCAVKT